jgi:alpha-amylase
MTKTRFFLGSHNHTPFGSRDEDFERAYRTRYKPFIAALYRFPTVPAVLHYSGVLLSWLEKRHPEFLMILEELVNRKQVELLGGGFYEPMMPLIPLADRIGQIELLTTYLRKHFGKRPRGCWLPGMMWEQSIAGSLQTCGMDYVFLDSDQFRAAGLSPSASERPCLTEDQGKLVTVFPISSRLSKDAATKEPKALIRSFAEGAADGGERFVAIFPESFAPPAANEAEYEGRLSALLEALSHSEELIELTTPSRSLKNYQVEEKAYFPSSAERRVMYWAMDDERRRGFDELVSLERHGSLESAASYFTGAFPRQFLIRYPEANGIYAKMIYTHILINQLRGDKYRKRTAREELWKAQGCDGFWHVEDGGVYRNSLRKAVYSALIEAEKITREKGVFIPSVVSVDFDMDGEREYLFQGLELNCYVKAEGGAIFELDHLSKAWNYLDTLARRHEPYADNNRIVDSYRRSAFIDRLLPPERSLVDVAAGRFAGGRCCAHERYEEIEVDRVHHGLALRSPENLSGDFGSIEIIKKYQLKKNVLTVSYALSNRGVMPKRFNFAPEIDLSFAGDSPELQRIRFQKAGAKEETPVAVAELRGIDELSIEDGQNDLALSLSSTSPFDLWMLPIFTRCKLDGVLTDQYQSTCFMPVRPVILAPGESWETSYTLKFGR